VHNGKLESHVQVGELEKVKARDSRVSFDVGFGKCGSIQPTAL